MAKLGELIYTYDGAAGEALGKRESHTPKIECPDTVKAGEVFDLKVTVGPHPTTLEHSIRWVELYFYEEGKAFNPVLIGKYEFAPGLAEACAALRLKLPKRGALHALGYCNLHGLWEGRKDIAVE